MMQRGETAGRVLDYMGDHPERAISMGELYREIGAHADATAIDGAVGVLVVEGLIIDVADLHPEQQTEELTDGYVLTQAGLEETGAEL